METSQRRTTTQGFQRMGGFNFTTEPRECGEHGPYLAMNTPVGPSGCPVCTKAILKAEDEQRIAEEHAANRRHQVSAMIGRAAIPPRFADRRFETFVPYAQGPADALRKVQAYAEDFHTVRRRGGGLILCGGVGAGKTHLAAAAAHCVIHQGYSALFTSIIKAIGSVKETYRRDSPITEAAAIAKFVVPDLLILDEVGVQYGSDTEKMILFEIINGRYEQIKPTIIISNLSLLPKAEKEPSLMDFLGERVVDRLREGGGSAIVFDWPSYRKEVA